MNSSYNKRERMLAKLKGVIIMFKLYFGNYIAIISTLLLGGILAV